MSTDASSGATVHRQQGPDRPESCLAPPYPSAARPAHMTAQRRVPAGCPLTSAAADVCTVLTVQR